jgi:hypothetical protein
MERADGVLLTWVPLAWKPSEPRRTDKPHQTVPPWRSEYHVYILGYI